MVRCGVESVWAPAYGGVSGNRLHTAAVSARNGRQGSGASHTTVSPNQPTRLKVTSNRGTAATTPPTMESTRSSIRPGGRKG
jgi:hypothetical protein